ncbi:MAG: T9SS type A sorting domain-containing protein [Chitinophagales bacterium]|nr:T9SS type A sorting domain-containing protein [Chitinophagales bacterium]
MFNYSYITLCCVLCSFALVARGQNEFYIQGDSLSSTIDVFLNGKLSNLPTLFIDGSLINQGGKLINDSSILEIRSNFSNNSFATNSFYQSSGIEKFSGSSNSKLTGNFSGDSANFNQLHYLILAKDSARNSLDLATPLHLHKNGSLNFENFGILRTDTLSHGKQGELYANYLFLQNSSNAAIMNHALSSGDSSKYLEGRLHWKLADGDSTYFLPIGGEENMEAMAIQMKGAAMLSIEAYISEADNIGSLAESGRVFHDIGTPLTSNSTIASSGCSAGADGILDLIELNLDAAIAWQINNISDGNWQTYDLILSPSAQNQLNIFNPMLSSGNCENIDLVYLSNNGIPGGNTSQYVSGVSPAWPNTSAYIAAPAVEHLIQGLSGSALFNQTTFGIYGIHSTEASNVTLPVELLFLEAKAIQNEFIQLSWETLSEINNSGFEILRSEDGINFESIAWKIGAGSSTSLQDYFIHDYEVEQGQVYYYRLKQIDFDGSASLSAIVSAKLLVENGSTQIWVYPNPIQANTSIHILSAQEDIATLQLYDALGKLIWQQEQSIKSGETILYLPTLHLAEGSYRLQVALAKESYSQQLLKLNK